MSVCLGRSSRRGLCESDLLEDAAGGLCFLWEEDQHFP